jgi:cobyrinic acid a,c-diamide synthase
MRGFLVAAPRSGSGKTTVTLGLMRALARRGLRVAGAKCGPDYIDPAFHRAATGRDSLNLDSWAMSGAMIAGHMRLLAEDADLVIAEGLMGLHDGVSGVAGRTGSSADIAAATGLPLLLVIDASGQSQTAGAVALGLARFDPRLTTLGVILNRTGSERHVRLATMGVEQAGLKVLGALPREASLVLPERHLGLVQAEETAGLDALIDRMADFIEAHVDLDGLRATIETPPSPAPLRDAGDLHPALPPPGQRIALARDAAFSFIYPHVLMGWRRAGAEIIPFSPLADDAPPEDCDACWLPGGYPELHGAQLAGAARFRDGLRRFAETRPVHGECGGYMVLGRAIIDAEGIPHEMPGLLGHATSFAKRKMNLGYRAARLAGPCALGPAGTLLRGHEFHYASVVEAGEDAPFAFVSDAHGAPERPDGGRRGLVTGSFFHAIAAEG